MSRPPLTALARPRASDPPVYRCACGCGAYASRGFPGDIWFTREHVPPDLRFPWEPGYVAPAVTAEPAPPSSPPGGAAASSQPELF